MAYDIESARKAGLSDAEINNYLASKYKYNLAGAREAGAPDTDILTHLLAKDKPVVKTTPTTEVAPISSPEEITSQAETSRGAFAAQPGAGLTEQQKRQLAEATAKYEKEVPFLQRQTDPIKAGVKGLSTVVPNLEITSLQKEINAIQEGKVGPRDPVTGEMTPLQPEEAEAAIKSLQARQAEAQKKVMGVQAEVSQIRKRPAVELLNDVTTARQAFQAFQADPLGIMASVSLESLPQVAPALVLGAVTRNPTVGALAMGSTSFASELSSGVMEYFQDNGVDTRDPVAVNKALNDPVLFAKAYGHALTRGSIIAVADTAAAGLASKMLVPKQLIKNQLAKEAVNIGVAQPTAQIISGGGGEILAQLATEGEVKKPGRAVLEAAGEGPTSLLETAAFGGQQAYERLPSTIAKKEAEAKAVEDQKKILDKLTAPGALENLGQQFNDTVEGLKTSINPKTTKKDGSGGRFYTEQEAYEAAGNLILQGGLLDGTESTIGGTDQSGVSVPGKPIETNTGAIDTTGGDLAATDTTTTTVGGGEGTELNTLVANLKAKYPQLTDEQALANAEESLRQKQIAAQQQAAGAGIPTPTSALTAAQEQRRTELKSILENEDLGDKYTREQGLALVDELIALENIAEGTTPPSIDTTDTTKDKKPSVTTGKSRGRPIVKKTSEQIAADAAYKKQRQDIGRNASNDINRAEKVLTQEVNTEQIINNAANEQDAISQLSQLKLQRIGALETAYRLSVDPDQKNKTAGKKASTLLKTADPKELETAKQIYESKKKIGAPSRAEISESTNGQDNTVFEKYNNARSAVNWIANNGNPFEKILARRLLPFLNGVKFVVVDSADDMPTAFLRDKMMGAAGLYVPDRKTIYVMRSGGINNTVVLHEALHAATVARIDAYLELREAGKPIPDSLERPVAELMALMIRAKDNFDLLFSQSLESGDLGLLTTEMLEIPNDAFTDVKEFVAYGMSLPAMQEFLLLSPGKLAGAPSNFVDRLFNKFVQSIRQLFSMDEKHTSALQDLIIVTNKLLAAPLLKVAPSEPVAAKAKQPAPPKTPKPPKAPKQSKTVENILRAIRLSKTGTELNRSIGELMLQTRNANDAVRLIKAVFNSINVNRLRLAMFIFDTNDITRMAGNQINNIKVINNAVESMAGMRTRMIREMAENVEPWTHFNAKYKEGGEILSDLINATTLLEVDPTKHPDLATALKNDLKLQQLEKNILNPPIDPKTNKPKNVSALKKDRTIRIDRITVIYEGGVYNNPVTGEKNNMGGWNKLGKIGKGEGHAIYKMAKDSYQETFNLHEQLLKEKIAASNVPGNINDASTPKGKLIAAITKTFQEAKTLEVYFPLMRYGNFWYSVGKGKSGEFYMFESSTARNNAIDKRVEELNKAGDKRTRDKMIEDGDIDLGDDIRKLREKHIESSDMLKEIFAMLDKNKTNDIDAVKDNIYQMYLMTLPDKDIRRKFVHRQGKTGFSADTLRNFIVSQHTAANQLARLKYADQIRNGIAAAYAEISQNPNKLKLAVLIKEISERALAEITPSVPEGGINWDQAAVVGNKFVFYWLLTSPKSALIQMTQLATVGLPTLGAQYGMAKTLATAFKYSALWNKLGVSKTDKNGNIITEWGQPSINDSNYIAKHPNLAYRKVLKDAWNFANDKDLFMSTYASDMTSMSEVPSGTYHNIVSRATRGTFNLIGGAFHHAERISREIMFMSSFELAYADNKKKGMDDKTAFDAATKKATSLTTDSLFDYTNYNKPPITKTAGGRIAFQFLTYPLQMTSYLVRNFYGMLPLLNKEEKKEAAIKFFGTMAMTGLFAGVTGLPLYSFIMGVIDGMRELLRDEDEEDYEKDDEGNPLGRRSTDLWVRNWFIPNFFGPESSLAQFLGLSEENAKTLARAFEMGVIPAYTDLNVAPSISLDGMWFRSDKPAETSREAFEQFLLGLGGPLVGLGGNIFASIDDFENGQFIRGFEKISPAFLKGSLTAVRLGIEGATTTKGDKLMDPEFYTTGKLFAQSLGFGSTEVAQLQKSNFLAKEIVVKMESDRVKLLNRFDIAIRDGIETESERQKVIEVLEKITAFNKKNPISSIMIEEEDIIKSFEARTKRRGESYQGLSVPEDLMPYIYPLVKGTRSP